MQEGNEFWTGMKHYIPNPPAGQVCWYTINPMTQAQSALTCYPVYVPRGDTYQPPIVNPPTTQPPIDPPYTPPDVVVTPEPATFALLACGIVATLVARRRK